MLKVILTLLILLNLPAKAHSLGGHVKVNRVIDGDTIEIQLSETKAKLRLVGIDCYETSKIHRAYKQAYLNHISIEEVIARGNQATDCLKTLINSQEIRVEIVGIDIYGRLLGIIYGRDNANINQTLINQGVCLEYVYKK